jgi:predicted Ser/Thr protein kinase
MNRTDHPVVRGIPFNREEFERSENKLIHKGRWANADVHLFRRGKEDWVVKDFRRCPPFIRNIYGSWMVGRELSAMRTLAGIPGFPQDAFRMDRFAFAYRFVPGMEIGNADPGLLTRAFFEELERLMGKMHARGVAHLDIRAAKNILVSERGDPFILDFQSHVSLEGLPRFLRALLVDIDRSGIYKHWDRRFPGSLDEKRAMLLERMNRLRRFWILKGYLGVKKNSP